MKVGLKTVTAETKARVNAKVADCIAKVNARYGINMRPVNIEYDINSSRTGGQAIYGKRTLRLNPFFLTLYTEKYLATTVPHELAHMAVRDVHGRGTKAHGYEWQIMMGVVGAPAKRCHTYEVPVGITLGKPKTKHHYKCQGCDEDVFVGPKIHAKITNGSKYFHPSCGKVRGQLVYAETVGKVSYKEAKRIVKQPKVPTPMIQSRVPLPTPVPVQKSRACDHAGMNKFDRCLAIYMSHPGKSRKAIISKFVDEVEMTVAGASTYYSKCAKEAAK